MFNLGRAIQSKWELQIQSDGSFAFCSAEIGVIVFGVNSLGSVFKQVSWSIVPNESSDAFAYAYNGIRAAFFCSRRGPYDSVNEVVHAIFVNSFATFRNHRKLPRSSTLSAILMRNSL